MIEVLLVRILNSSQLQSVLKIELEVFLRAPGPRWINNNLILRKLYISNAFL
jgi:hypothetical protein